MAATSPTREDTTLKTPTYTHDRLDLNSDQIRLLTLHAASERKTPIRISLKTVPRLSVAGGYEALSYTWGSASNSEWLSISDHQLAIRPNLASALRCLRQSHKPRVLWIDAVCINQASDTEKSHQVRQMFSIYQNASRVLVWLGEANTRDIEAMKFLQLPEETRKDLVEPVDALYELFNRQWWSRVWVVQEVLAAKSDPQALCGDLSVPWSACSSTLAQLAIDEIRRPRFKKLLASPNAELLFNVGHRFGEKRHFTLERLLKATSSRNASDPRDHVYALLGLAQESPTRMLPDYSCSTEVVYQDAFVAVCQDRKDLDWLFYAAGPKSRQLQSWCMDFSQKGWQEDSLRRFWGPNLAGHRKEVNASIGRDFSLSHDRDHGTICVHGAVIGVIDQSNELEGREEASNSFDGEVENHESGKNTSDNVGVMEIAAQVLLFTILARPALERRYGSEMTGKMIAGGEIWKTIAGGEQFRHQLPNSKKFSTAAGYGYEMLEKYFRENVKQWNASLDESSQPVPETFSASENLVVEILATLALRVAHHRCFTTDTGYIGRSGPGAQEEDVLAIIFGCSRPAIIRPCSNGQYKLVTFTYTHGVMEGEFIQQYPKKQQKFVIC